jgi:uncharacterized membrane protein
MVTFIGLIILLVGITLWLLERQNKISERKNEEIRQYNENRDSYGRRQLKSTFDVPVKWYIPAIVGVLLTFLGFANPFSLNDATER